MIEIKRYLRANFKVIPIILTIILSACSTNKVMQSSLVESIPLSEITEQHYIDKYLKNQQLDEIEGIWTYEDVRPISDEKLGLVYKSDGIDFKVMIIKNPNESESDYIGVVVKTDMINKGFLACTEERVNDCQLKPGDQIMAFNKTDTKNLFYGISQKIIGDCNVCYISEGSYSRFVRYADGIQKCDYIGDSGDETDFQSYLNNINEFSDYEKYSFHILGGKLKKTFPAESSTTIASLKKNVDRCGPTLFGKYSGTIKPTKPSMPSMLGVLLGAYLDSKDAKKSYVAPRNFESAIKQLDIELITASKYFFQSQQLLHKAYGNDKEAKKIAAHLKYLSNSKYSNDEKIKNSIQVTTTSSKALEVAINDESIILTEEGRKYYSKSLPHIQQGIVSTVKIVPLVTDITEALSEQSSKTKLLGSLAIIGSLTYVPEFMGNMYESMRLALSDAKAKDIQGIDEIESQMGEL